MAHTVELLSLIDEYPDAFVEPSEAPVMQASSSVNQATSETDGLLSLISEFPEAFVEPSEAPVSSGQNTQESKTNDQQATTETLESPAFDIPQGYEMALHQTISTFGWGTVQAYLRYDSQALHSIWLQVGKSGTEVQSFCEAIARLTNRLLASGTPIVEIVKELRGIRGGDSEGLGPHRFLGLVDLFGKILQDAPETVGVSQVAASPVSVESGTMPSETAPIQETSPVQADVNSTATAVSTAHPWVELSDTSAIASICPECGAELQQVNGCSGGACVVCGYSSCS